MMIRPPTLAAVACACALAGCASFKKGHSATPPPTPAPTADTPSAPPEPIPKPPVDDGLRTGNLLVMPRDTEYRATHPDLPKANAGTGTVIVTPPSSPKSKPQDKPQDKPQE